MSIIWCGGEDIDFPNGTVSVTTTSTYRRTSYSRCALGGGTYFYSTPFQEVSNAWLSFRYYNFSTWASTMMGLTTEDGITGYWVYVDSSFKLSIRKYDSGWSTIASESGSSFGYNSIYKLDMGLTYGVSGNVKLYVNVGSTPVINYSGDLSISGVTGFTRVGGHGITLSNGGGMSEVIVSTIDTRLMNLKTLAPNAAGDTNDWTGAYTDIDEVAMSSSDLIYTTDKGDNFQANLTGMPSGTLKVKAVKMIVSGLDAAHSLGLKVGVKTNSVVHLRGSVSLGGTWDSIEKYYQNNPETTSAFTSGEIDALQLALRCDSTTTTTTVTTTTTGIYTSCNLFWDDFETNDLSKWDGSVGANTTSSSPYEGTYCADLSTQTDYIYKNITATNEMYLDYMWKPASGWTSTEGSVVNFRWSASGTETIQIFFYAADNGIYVYRDGSLIDSELSVLGSGWQNIEVYVKIANSGGRVVVRVDGEGAIDFTGDTQGSYSTFDRVVFGNGNNFSNDWAYCYLDRVCFSSTGFPAWGVTTTTTT